MILTKEISIYISNRNIKHFKDLGYNAVMFSYLTVKVSDLPSGSHYKVLCSCDNCEKQREMMYFEYLRYGDKYLCRKCAEEKRKETSIANWGVDNPSKSEMIKKKIGEGVRKNKINI